MLGEVDLLHVGRTAFTTAAGVRRRGFVPQYGPVSDEGSASLGGVDESVGCELLERKSDGGPGDAVLIDELSLTGHTVARLELTGADAVAQVIGDLPPQRDAVGGRPPPRRPAHRGDGAAPARRPGASSHGRDGLVEHGHGSAVPARHRCHPTRRRGPCRRPDLAGLRQSRRHRMTRSETRRRTPGASQRTFPAFCLSGWR